MSDLGPPRAASPSSPVATPPCSGAHAACRGSLLSARRAIMLLPLATLKELQKLSALKGKGVILERQYEVGKQQIDGV